MSWAYKFWYYFKNLEESSEKRREEVRRNMKHKFKKVKHLEHMQHGRFEMCMCGVPK